MVARGKIMAALLAMAFVFSGTAFASVGEELVGNYRGTFIGDDYGSFLVDVGPDGTITGTVHSNVSYLDMEVKGTCAPNGDCEFVTEGEGALPFYFMGRIDFMNRFIGKWSYTDHSGRGSFYGMIQKE